MHLQEREDFDGALWLVNRSKFAEAFPVLKQLYDNYPENSEIKQAYEMVLSGYRPPESAPQPQPQYYTQSQFSQPNPTINTFYFVPLVGSILMCVAVFLPWASFAISSGIMSAGGTKDGLGNLSGSPLFTASAGKSGGVGDGIFVLVIAIICAIFCLIGLFNQMDRAWLPGLVLGIIGGGIAVFNYSDITTKAKTLKDGLGANVSGSIQVGTGIYLTLIAAIVVVLGNLVIKSKKA